MNCRISVIIPNWNGEETIGRCLDAIFASQHDSFEVIVVDDCSEDNSVTIISKYPCKLVELEKHRGAAGARNVGVSHSRGDILFFTDADCLVGIETLSIAEKAVVEQGPDVIVGGTYTCMPFDPGFFSIFQSVFIHYSEMKKVTAPDYIATHAMAVAAKTFRSANGFVEDFLPILEDVEFSHRAQRQGYQLVMEPQLLVQHIFNYSLSGSLKNAFVKTRYWTMYSIANRDLLVDSGTASFELKINVVAFYVGLLLCMACLVLAEYLPLSFLWVPFLVNFVVSRKLLGIYFSTGGTFFALSAGAYYMFVYPLAIGCGAVVGAGGYYIESRCNKSLYVIETELNYRPEKMVL
jgi:glycosyltransferase involved in cell wall biosynthesis